MSRLDTRGFMDGALRAYDIVDRKLSRDEDREIRKQQLEKSNQRADQQMALRMADEERRTQAHEYQYGVDGEGGRFDKRKHKTKSYLTLIWLPRTLEKTSVITNFPSSENQSSSMKMRHYCKRGGSIGCKAATSMTSLTTKQ